MNITHELKSWNGVQLSAMPCSHDALEGIADRIDEAVDGMVKLPKDADGEYIHVGDVMEFSAFEVEKPVTRTVDGIGQGVFFAWCGERGYQQHEAKRYCHHHAPTVEDVLREFADEVYADADNEIRDRDFLCAKYAKRLKLAEGEDA